MYPYLVLLRMGFSLPSASLRPRCALTAPGFPPAAPEGVHLFTLACATGDPCGRTGRPSAVLLSVPLSVASRRLAVSQHPALWSPDFPPRASTRRLSVQLPGADCNANAVITPAPLTNIKVATAGILIIHAPPSCLLQVPPCPAYRTRTGSSASSAPAC